MRHKYKRTLRTCCISLAVILACGLFLKISYPSLLFKKYVCNPIPKSVKNIKAQRTQFLFSGHKYVMRFKINKADLMLILNSRPFKEVEWVQYENGFLNWGKTPLWEKQNQGGFNPTEASWEREGMCLYEPQGGRPGPEWFRPDDWKSPKVYEFKQRSISYRLHMQVLIYNEELSEAYLVEDLGGKW